MGKRELLIILGFVVVGVVAYQFTAPAASTSQGFSFSKMWEAMRREVRGNNARAETTLTGSAELPARLTEIRFTDVSRLQVIGESRDDLAYELKVESTGPDDATALEYAKRTVLKQDDMGSALAFRVEYPAEARQQSELTVRVPSRMELRIQGGSRLEASNLSSVRLEGVSSTVKISLIAGRLTGVHRSGDLEIAEVGSVRLTLQGSQAKFERIREGLTLDARNSECGIQLSRGAIEIEETNSRVTIEQHDGPVRIGGERGRIVVDGPTAETRVDVRRAEVEVTLRKAVPLTLVTTDEALRFLLDGPPAVTVDAVAPEGQIKTPGLELAQETRDGEPRLTHAFAAGATARVSLRNLRGEIVIRMAK